MKTIIKSEETLDCLHNAEAAGWNWETFHENAHEDYVHVQTKALECQGHECAYTGLWLGDGTSHIVHLDHFHKKSIYPQETFCWSNLFAAAKNLDYGADYKDRNIHGPRQNANTQYEAFWSPMQPELANAFWYRKDGTMEPDEFLSNDDKEKAQRTIDMYNLNAPELKNKRRGIMLQISSIIGQLSDDDIRSCMLSSGFSFLVEFELRQR